MKVYALLAVLPIAPTAAVASLRDLADQNGIFFGAATNFHTLSTAGNDQVKYNDTCRTEYSLITAENACKYSATEPSQGQFDFEQCDYLAKWTKDQNVNQTFRGHNLCWGVHNPDWLTKLPADQLKGALENHINNVVPHYNGIAYGWDVVNEAIIDGGNTSVLFKNNTWYPAVPDYVDFAFTTARKAASKDTKLFYNDYNVGSSTGWSQAKSDRMYNMVKDMQSRNIPIDGVGLQLHVDINYALADGVAANIKRYEGLGIEVHLTEVDVGCIKDKSGTACQAWGEAEKKKQAEVYSALLQACLESTACKNFETWGFTDAYTWRKGLHPLPFDENFNEKPAVQAMRDVMEKALVGETSTWVSQYYARVGK